MRPGDLVLMNNCFRSEDNSIWENDYDRGPRIALVLSQPHNKPKSWLSYSLTKKDVVTVLLDDGNVVITWLNELTWCCDMVLRRA